MFREGLEQRLRLLLLVEFDEGIDVGDDDQDGPEIRLRHVSRYILTDGGHQEGRGGWKVKERARRERGEREAGSFPCKRMRVILSPGAKSPEVPTDPLIGRETT